MFDYIRDPAEIYKNSFAAVRAATDLSGFSGIEADIVVRLVHACAMPEITEGLVFSDGAVAAGRQALGNGASVLVDAEMVGHGIIKKNLAKKNAVLCTLNDEGVAERAREAATTRSAAAVDLWGDSLKDAVVAISNAPTALFRLLELLDGGAPRPALILGFPVGFIGAAESKDALIEHAPDFCVPFITLKGRRGGSALAAAAVNALVQST
ncbi:MAG: precorrin-8X methylmutase [Proteobacteria bacterium]|nr:precorrin-8X methylmutase [Pseudomonadota bacterium]MDA1022040.1 precorrin-8X methylmutase [Pseudomonadota bacterium]